MALGGVEALHRLKSIDPPLWLTPSPDLSQTSQKASQYIFSSLKPFCPKPLLDTLLIHGFDAEQIWQQIDLQTQPLISNLRRDVKQFERSPEELSKLFGGEMMKKSKEKIKDEGLGEESESDDEGLDDEENEENGDSDVEEDDEEEEEEDEKEEDGSGRGIEDRFLKINELEEYMETDEAREYGGENKKDKDANEDNEEDDDDEIGGFEDDSDGDESAENLGQARYEDFFGGKKKKVSKMEESKPHYELEDEEQEDDNKEENDDEQENDDGQEDDEGLPNQTNGSLSTHEKELKKLHSKIEQMEKENLEKSSWTMQGEVTASKRPKNSALEVDLDFERNARPMPVITEEVTASREELIKKRILEENFDDVQKAPSLPTKAPKEIKELDENKSKKGLGEIYEEEFVQQTGLGTGPVSSTDELKKEAQLLFDKLCLKLDALSHFHFKPKPVIEDMSIQTNVPALAMEEVAPVAVSDAAMLAPEEVFAGKGDIKEEAELTQAERKRRRANKKRKFKAEESKRVVKKVQDKTPINNINGKEVLC